ncbi:hypothetical protein GCM10010249_38080 [Streptomyces roseolilacinus]|uniref:Secreted protein n=1 Tax=Streptomyces roseolilacinus TaxID=66904 RepID=A0A918B5B4_9ACTN|nr:hypothetical protein GCM10010249_38080 [Streptomyces roseolilacinus]
MKLGRIAAAAVLAASIPFVGTAQPAAAANTHTVTLQGTMEVVECCGLFGASDKQIRDINRSVRLTHGQAELFKETVCAGGEARGELRVNVRVRSSEALVVVPTLRLFEGSSCSNLDLDGQGLGGGRNLPLGTAQTWVLNAFNNEFHSADYASAWFSVIHKIGPGG